MNKTSWCLTLPDKLQVNIVIDAHESESQARTAIADSVRAVMDAIPHSLINRFYFLGSDQSYTFQQLERAIGQHFSENENRISLIRPIAEKALQETNSSKILLISSGLVYDIEDWVDQQDIYLLQPNNTNLTITQELPTYSLERISELVSEINDEICEVRINFSDSLPVDWSPGEFFWTGSCLKLTNVAQLSNRKLHVTQLGFAEQTPDAEIITAQGRVRRVKLMKDFPRPTGRIPVSLSSEEIEVIKQIIQKQPFLCPSCQKNHSEANFYCTRARDGWDLPSPIFPRIISNGWKKGLILFRQVHDDIRVEYSDQPCYLLSANRVLLQEEGAVNIYEANLQKQSWSFSTVVPGSFIEGENGQWIVIL